MTEEEISGYKNVIRAKDLPRFSTSQIDNSDKRKYNENFDRVFNRKPEK